MNARTTAHDRRSPGATRLASSLLVASLVAVAVPGVPAGAQDSTRTRADTGVVLPPDSSRYVLERRPVRIRDLGPRRSGRLLRAVLSRPHIVLAGDTTRTSHLRRDTTITTSVVVLGGDLTLASRVQGDVVVVGGDLFMHPGGLVEGRAMAFGGCVYRSSLAIIRGDLVCERDHTFAIEPGASEITLAYRVLERFDIPLVQFPAFGLHLPEYTRVDGAVVPWGPTVTLAEGGVELLPRVAYRSNLGAIDPSVAARVRLGRRNQLTGDIGRGTFSNDRWIRSNLVNSFTTLFAGVDTRNYWRADRAELRAERTWESATRTVRPWLGARAEKAWSTGPDSVIPTPHRPWTIMVRNDPEGILRPNPDVARGTTTSALAGIRVDEETATGLTTEWALMVERSLSLPGPGAGGGMTQLTGDVELSFPTFGTQSFDLLAHAVLTDGAAPPQRYAYLGGNGTLLTLDLLALGGDQLAYVDSRYHVPVERIQLPFVGPPIVTLRHAIGTAGVGRLPTWVQNLGVRLALAVVRFDYTIDPATRRTNFDISFSMAR